MNRTTSPAAGLPASHSASATIQDAAQAAHQATDTIADKAIDGVGRFSGTAHRAVNTTADAASSAVSTATDWAATIPDQAKEVQAQLLLLKAATSNSIQARPFATVAGAVVIGYLLGRFARN